MRTGASVRKAKEALKTAGYQMSVAEIVPPSIKDSENAAVELNKVFGLLTLGSDEMYSPGKVSGKVAAQYTDVMELHEPGVHMPFRFCSPTPSLASV